ncbi:hypothetical protein [Oxalicibacterium solurbis]|uniref:DUF2790 domain-containing protein n=1 Tax=Oxalicibacterium solurbis TaxID=69280 RepID=A0A8J3F5A2_9BURK|nr:hypothetical protein [Oxalicibacterium solurbis]GGI55307.1 hypothetical protein GCM10011430_24810 [Oxalicibacterium solurbis]
MRRILLTGVLAMAVGGVWASSPEAWQALYNQTAQACLKKSVLKDARIVDGPVVFNNAIVYRIKGIQPQGNGQVSSAYCLHPYPDGSPEVAESTRKR